MSIIAAKPPRFAGSDPFIESDRSGGFGRFADPPPPPHPPPPPPRRAAGPRARGQPV